MTVHTLPDTKYVKGVRWLAELYEKKQVSSLTAQTLNKAVEYEVNQSKAQLAEIEKVLADYEKQFDLSTVEFFKRYQAGQTDDSAESVEWASLAQMAEASTNDSHCSVSHRNEPGRISRVGQRTPFDRLCCYQLRCHQGICQSG